jgi:hypothetical protein
MNHRQRIQAILHDGAYDRMPAVHFGFWIETLEKWVSEGHLKPDDIVDVSDGNDQENAIAEKLGFEFNWMTLFRDKSDILSSVYPPFEKTILENGDDGSMKVLNPYGVIELKKKGVVSIPLEIDHLLKDRPSWEELFKPRLQYSDSRIDWQRLAVINKDADNRQYPLGLFCGSLYGQLRNMMGITGISYLAADDETLLDEMIDTVGNLSYQTTEKILSAGVSFDFAHFWEDICFKNGPLVSPSLFREKVGPHYRKITDLLHRFGIDIVSLDCDGQIDTLIPTWIESGVNTMFPVEVGTWNASIAPWRRIYGRSIRAVGGMDKNVLAQDRDSVDREIERLKPLVALGGYVPCPDHRLPPAAKWDNVQYYCEQIRKSF